MDTTPGHIAHVAINADDLDASRAFYEATFGWRFSPHMGMDDFLRIDAPTGGRPGPFAVLQRRRDLGTIRVAGGECTVAVDDISAAVSAAVAAGGQLLLEPTTIPGVGTLAWFADPAGNPIGAMQYDLPPG